MGKVGVVTGGNQGLGYSLVRAMCRSVGENGVVYLGARDPARGQQAVQRLREEGFTPRLHVVDVTDDEDVAAFAGKIAAEHGGVDIVISNAAARRRPDVPDADQARMFIDTNNYGAHRMIRAFGPLLNDNARFVVVASAFGSLHHLAGHLHHLFDTRSMALTDLEAVMDRYCTLVEDGTAVAEGWPQSINVPSKIGQVAAIRIMARDHERDARARGVLINAACPGLVDTEASRPWFADMSAAQSPDEAAVDVAWLCTLPAAAREPYGELVQHRDIIPFAADDWTRKFG